MQTVCHFLFILTLISGTFAGIAEEQPLPQELFFPLQVKGVQPERAAKLRPIWDQAYTQLQAKKGRNLQPLSARLQPNSLPLVATGFAQDVQVGELQEAAPFPLIIQPVWCSFYTHDLAFLLYQRADYPYLLGVGQMAIPKTWWQDTTPAAQIQGLTDILVQAAEQGWRQRVQIPEDNGLQVELTSMQRLTRAEKAFHGCLDLLLSSVLSRKGLKVASPLEEETWAQVHRHLPLGSRRLRTSRRVLTQWEIKEKSQTGQFAARLHLRYGEGIFASPTFADQSYPIEAALPATAAPFAPAFPEEIATFLLQEQQHLQFASRPKIVGIKGAWVYLDKGRAWGLQLHDRLQTSTGISKGHVIGYYRPGEGGAPTGDGVREGAIVFIRSGQRSVQIGQTLDFDPQTFPSQ